MSMQYIRDTYKVPAKRGGKVRYLNGLSPFGKKGTIIGSKGAYIKIRFDNDDRTHIFHPTWKIEYL